MSGSSRFQLPHGNILGNCKSHQWAVIDGCGRYWYQGTLHYQAAGVCGRRWRLVSLGCLYFVRLQARMDVPSLKGLRGNTAQESCSYLLSIPWPSNVERSKPGELSVCTVSWPWLFCAQAEGLKKVLCPSPLLLSIK